jgi:hypothetical protein
VGVRLVAARGGVCAPSSRVQFKPNMRSSSADQPSVDNFGHGVIRGGAAARRMASRQAVSSSSRAVDPPPVRLSAPRHGA